MIDKQKIVKIGLIALIVVIALVALISIININDSKKNSKPVYFTPEPETWIEHDANSQNAEDYEINVNKATKTLSISDGLKQEYYYYGKRVTFFSHGYYKGVFFTQAYLDPSAWAEMKNLSSEQQIQMLQQRLLIKLSPNINPKDGIMNGFILAKVEDNDFVFYIFLDEDWKNKLPETNVLWANDLTDPEDVNYRKFDFSNQKDGIYVDKVSFNADWFKTSTNGGIFVGDLSPETLKVESQKDLNATFIYLQ